MEFYSSEKEQLEAMRKWWSENWLYIASGLTLGVVAVVGWNQWQAYVLERAQKASARYTEMVGAFNVETQPIAEDILAELKTEYASTPYAADAALYSAAVHVKKADLESAERELHWVIAASPDESKVVLARIRLARVLNAMSRYQEAIDELTNLDGTGFNALANTIRGDAYVALRDMESARAAYALSLEQAKPGLLDRELVQLKLDNLQTSSAVNDTTELADTESVSDSQ